MADKNMEQVMEKAQVTVTLSPSDNRATATIIPNFNSLNVTLDGQLVPFKESSVFKGTTF